jgi:hypothetical protein
MQIVISDLKVGPEIPCSPPAVQPGPATPQQVREIIDGLLAFDDSAGLVRAMQSERMILLDSIASITASNPLLKPMFQLDQLRTITSTERLILASSEPTAARAQAVLAAQLAATAGAPIHIASILSSPSFPGLNRVIQTNMRIRMDRKLTAAALAARLYRHDHGHWPQSLVQLVPDYLPAVPLDVMSKDDAPVQFLLIPGGLPDGSPRPVVYSVGEDGRDDTVLGALPPPEPQFGWSSATSDQYRDLTRWLPAAASTQSTDGRTETQTSPD